MGLVWLLTVWCAVGTIPYEDTRGRFQVEVPEAWSLSPRFGDVRGMTFERGTARGSSLLLTVWADPQDEGIDAWRTLEVELAKIGTLERRRAPPKRKIRGLPAQSRAYRIRRSGDDLAVTAHVFDGSGFRYTIWWQTGLRDARRGRRWVDRFLRSFRVASPPPAAAPPTEAPTSQPSAPVPLGRWKSDSGIVLVLNKNGSFSLADLSGRYRWDGAQLHLSMSEGTQSFSVSQGPDTLILSSPALDEPIRYRRVARKNAARRLVGTWKARRIPKMKLVLRSDGQFVLGKATGQWLAEDGRLRLRRSERQILSYTYRFRGKSLVLEGADLDDTLVLDRK